MAKILVEACVQTILLFLSMLLGLLQLPIAREPEEQAGFVQLEASLGQLLPTRKFEATDRRPPTVGAGCPRENRQFMNRLGFAKPRDK